MRYYAPIVMPGNSRLKGHAAMLITVYSKPECHLCEEVMVMLNRLTPLYDLNIREYSILDDPEMFEAYQEKIPVVVAEDGKYGWLSAPIEEPELRRYLDFVKRGGRRVFVYQETKLDKALDFVSDHWLRFLSLALGIFVGLPIAAPIFAALGWWGIADPIYTAYALQCHQLPERTAYLFGYEVAQCWRCQALYGGVLLFAILFGVARDRKVSWLQWLRKPLPWYWFVLMVLPIFFDGVTHMLGIRDMLLGDDANTSFGSFLIGSQVYSLNWILRIVTGLLAALGTAWFAFPRMNQVVQESQEVQTAYRAAMATRQVPAVGQ